jgi:YVTN family beta-propeller protein
LRSAWADNSYSSIYVVYSPAKLRTIDSDTHSVIAESNFSASYGTALSRDGTKLYLGNAFGTISVLDLASNTITATIDLGATQFTPYILRLSPDGNSLYVGTAYDTILVVSTKTNAVTGSLPLGTGQAPNALAVSPDNSKLYVEATVNSVLVVDITTATVTATIAAVNLGALALTPDGSKLLIGDSPHRRVLIADTSTNLVTDAIPVDAIPVDIAISPDGSKAYVSNGDPSTATTTVSVISTSLKSVIATIGGFNNPGALAIIPNGTELYVANGAVVSVVDTATGTVKLSIPNATTITGNASSARNIFAGPSRMKSTLSVKAAGNGSGTVTSPAGIACGTNCSIALGAGNSVALSAKADAGSVFVGWSGGGCFGNQGCSLTLSSDTTIMANFVQTVATNIALGAATLPSSRSVLVGSTASFFGTIINSGPGVAMNCAIAPTSQAPGSFFFQTTDPATNNVTGTPNTPVDIPQGGQQSFLLAFTPTAAVTPTDIAFTFACTNASAAPVYSGINTLLFSASTTPVPDIIALSATPSGDGILDIAGTDASAAFGLAVINIGANAQLFAQVDTASASLPLTLTICRSNPSNGICTTQASSFVPTSLSSNETATFSIFATSKGSVAFLPAVNRIFVRFIDASGATRGSTSVAVRTQ